MDFLIGYIVDKLNSIKKKKEEKKMIFEIIITTIIIIIIMKMMKMKVKEIKLF